MWVIYISVIDGVMGRDYFLDILKGKFKWNIIYILSLQSCFIFKGFIDISRTDLIQLLNMFPVYI